MSPPQLRPQPRTVLMTADAVGGVWRYALDLAAGLGQRGVRVVLAVMGPSPADDQRREVARLRNVILVDRPFHLEWMERGPIDAPAAGAWLIDLERRWQPDVVHLNGYVAAALPWWAPVVVTGHSCVRSWWRAVRGRDAPAEWDAYADGVAMGLRRAQVVTTPTRAFLGELEALYGPLPRARVVPNGAEPGRFHPSAGPAPEILAAGRLWDEAKGIDLLARIAPALPWPVVVAGRRRHPDGRVVHMPGVEILGRLDAPAMAQRMERAAVFAAPARYEPFGLAVLEAALAGCTLVLSDIPTFREVWQDAALFVPQPSPNAPSPGAWAKVLSAVAADGPARAAWARRARQRALTYRLSHTVEATLAAYRDAMTLRAAA